MHGYLSIEIRIKASTIRLTQVLSMRTSATRGALAVAGGSFDVRSRYFFESLHTTETGSSVIARNGVRHSPAALVSYPCSCEQL
ncbi:hypothetical protein RHOER0001_0877 [Rhodococcus erythropolis SK121]|nr:hypothetical protein RHOER0001_0877 [Rhodococcus erythropolis SK121]